MREVRNTTTAYEVELQCQSANFIVSRLTTPSGPTGQTAADPLQDPLCDVGSYLVYYEAKIPLSFVGR